MCTLSLLALAAGGYRLGMNRDERRSRGVALPPAVFTLGGRRLVAPRDPDGGGTWIALDHRGRTLCLMNGDRPAAGAIEPATPRSRGLLVLDLVAFADEGAIVAELAGRHRRGELRSRPFKLVVVTPGEGGPARARRIGFDGRSLEDAVVILPHVETSNGVDPEAAAGARGASFRAFCARHGSGGAAGSASGVLREDLIDWHATHASEPPHGDVRSVCLHREEVATVSFTLVEVMPEVCRVRYQPGQPCARIRAVELSL